jgi:putative PEP-CTERM system histidine kinase
LLVVRADDEDRFSLQAAWPEPLDTAIDGAGIRADDDLPQFLERRQWVVDLREYQDHPERYGALVLPCWLNPQGPWRIVTPLLIGNKLLGFLVLKAPPEPFNITFEDRDLLKTVGRNVAVQLAERAANAKLAESRQFDAYNRFVAFVMHDLKNAVAQLQLVVANADRHLNNPVFIEDAIGTIRNASERMTRLIEQLQSRELLGVARPVELTAIARAAVERAAARRPAARFMGEACEICVSADPDRLASIIDHVIRNAQEATAPDGSVSVEIRSNGPEVHLHVVDSGVGMDDEFIRQRLFRPFDSTKGSKGMGIGAYQVREYVRSVRGEVEVQSRPGSGTDFCIRLIQCQKTNQDS